MPTNADIAADLLREAASFFRRIAADNEDIQDAMLESAGVYDVVATLVQDRPTEQAKDALTATTDGPVSMTDDER